ncbi:MAG: DEAD/DEAH box helicase family protein [Bacilli bacterium]
MAFKSRYKGKSVIDSPEVLFNDLKNRSVQGLLSHQADILRDYQEHALNKKDVALELPTGSGKTLIGLLIGEFRRRANNEHVVYLCPTRQLVHQVVEQSASKYGIKTNAFVGKQTSYDPVARSEYSNSESIAVTTYNGLHTYQDSKVSVVKVWGK